MQELLIIKESISSYLVKGSMKLLIQYTDHLGHCRGLPNVPLFLKLIEKQITGILSMPMDIKMISATWKCFGSINNMVKQSIIFFCPLQFLMSMFWICLKLGKWLCSFFTKESILLISFSALPSSYLEILLKYLLEWCSLIWFTNCNPIKIGYGQEHCVKNLEKLTKWNVYADDFWRWFLKVL